MDEEWRSQVAEDGDRLFRSPGRVGGDADVERFTLAHGGIERAHRLFQRGLGIEAVRIEDVDVLEAHPLQALVEARQQVLSRAPDAVRPRPHVVAGLRRDHQLVAAPGQVRAEDAAEVLLGRAVRRPVVVRQVEVGDPEIEGPADDRPLRLHGAVAAKILPEPKRDRRQFEAAAAGAPERHAGITLSVLHHDHCVPPHAAHGMPLLRHPRNPPCAGSPLAQESPYDCSGRDLLLVTSSKRGLPGRGRAANGGKSAPRSRSSLPPSTASPPR